MRDHESGAVRMSWLSIFPLSLIGLVILCTLSVAVGLGYFSQQWLIRRAGARSRPGPEQAHLLTAVLGLLALLLGFSFSMVMDRYDTRRLLVVEEANAIGTTWLRVQILDAPARQTMGPLLQRYTDARLVWSETGGEEAARLETEALQRQLWISMGDAMRGSSPPLLARGVMDSLNESFDLAVSRQAARAAHMPDAVFYALIIYAAVSMVMMGAMLGAHRKPHLTQTMLLLFLLTLIHMVILDLDRPRSGNIQVSQQALLDLRQTMIAEQPPR